MINNESVLAVIPARGGSKRTPRKNAASYMGKPLLSYAIDGARGSKYIDSFCVSSDDAEILLMASKLGAPIIKRPDWLADDHAMNEGVLIHTLYTHKWADWVVLLQPTSPHRTSEDIDTCLERAQLGRGCITFNEHGARNGAVYVTRSTYLISRAVFSTETFDQFFIMPNSRSLDIDYPADLNA